MVLLLRCGRQTSTLAAAVLRRVLAPPATLREDRPDPRERINGVLALHPRELKLGEALVRLKVIDELQLASALASADQWGQRLTEALLRLRLARELSIVEAIASITRTEKVDLAVVMPQPGALALLEAEYCRRQGIFPFALTQDGRTLQLAMVDPSDVTLCDAVAARTRLRVQRFVAGENAIQKAIQRHYLGAQVALQPQPEEAPISELEEIKLVDIHGRTLQLTAAVMSLKEDAAAAPQAIAATSEPNAARRFDSTARLGGNAGPNAAAGRSEPAARAGVDPGSRGIEGAAQRGSAAAGNAEPALQRIHDELSALQHAQQMNERALKALIALLAERGYIRLDELKARLGRGAREGS